MTHNLSWGHLAAFAAAATSLKRSNDSAMLQLMFFWLKASLAAPKMATSSAPAAKARSKPCTHGRIQNGNRMR